jgi:hypothetical protein
LSAAAANGSNRIACRMSAITRHQLSDLLE